MPNMPFVDVATGTYYLFYLFLKEVLVKVWELDVVLLIAISILIRIINSLLSF
jgi:hypothetical protein